MLLIPRLRSMGKLIVVNDVRREGGSPSSSHDIKIPIDASHTAAKQSIATVQSIRVEIRADSKPSRSIGTQQPLDVT